jgi:hypothetical protein
LFTAKENLEIPTTKLENLNVFYTRLIHNTGTMPFLIEYEQLDNLEVFKIKKQMKIVKFGGNLWQTEKTSIQF